MAGSVNKVILIGNLGKDPEIRTLENSVKLARFPIATSESYQDKSTGERREITDWHNIVVWRGLADIAERYLLKGMKVYVEGKIKTRSWQDETGNTRYQTEIVADNFTILTPKSEHSVEQNNATNPYPQEDTPKAPSAVDEKLLDDSDDDILPF